MTLTYSDIRKVSDAVRDNLAPQFAALKRDFTAATDAQQRQLDRIEAQLTRVLALLEPKELTKPVPVTKKTAGDTPHG